MRTIITATLLAAALTTLPAAAQDRPAAGAPGAGCSGSGDIQQLLSPDCLESLKSLSAPGASPNVRAPSSLPSVPALSGGGIPNVCTVTVFSGTVGAASGYNMQGAGATSFTAPSMERCIEVGVKMGYGVPGITNIVASDAVYGVIGVTCRREAPDGKRVTCTQQGR